MKAASDTVVSGEPKQTQLCH